jgi:hypothetical protein
MKVLIVGRTKMGESSRCIGGLSHSGQSIRLMNQKGKWPISAPFQIGDIWEMAYQVASSLRSPHSEDVIISKQNFVSIQENLTNYLLQVTKPSKGSIGNLFDGLLSYTTNSNGYISSLNIPNHSTSFWISDRDLNLRDDGTHYDYPDRLQNQGLKYVGEPLPKKTIPAGTLLRVSLARWWKQKDADPNFEERCYLQLSGWFL